MSSSMRASICPHLISGSTRICHGRMRSSPTVMPTISRRTDISLRRAETARILRHRLQGSEGDLTLLPYGEPLDLPGETPAQLTLYPAGHCLGSAQALIEVGGTRICYTGDMKLRPNVAAENGVVVPCDILITECTFGEPRYVFPPDADMRADLRRKSRRHTRQGRCRLCSATRSARRRRRCTCSLAGATR